MRHTPVVGGLLLLIFLGLWGTLHAAQAIRIDVALTQVTAIVTDASGDLVTGLTADDFTIEEDGVRQKIGLFTNEVSPITLGMLIDRSGSMQYSIKTVVSSAVSFLDAFGAEDEAFIGEFASGTAILRDFTRDRKSLFDGLMSINSVEGGTEFFPALQDVLVHIRQGSNKKRAVVVFTDGKDTSSFSKDEIQRLARISEIPIYGIGITGMPSVSDGVPRIIVDNRRVFDRTVSSIQTIPPPKQPPKRELTVDPSLSKIVAETGGRVFQIPLTGNASELVALTEKAATKVLAEIRGQYLLGYYSSSSKDKLHAIRVRTTHPELTVRSRRNALAK